MFQKRSVLWMMLLSGVVIHMMSSSNLNIAVNSMINYTTGPEEKPFIPVCQQSSPFFGSGAEQRKVGEFSWSSNEKHYLLSSWSWFMGLSQLAGGILCQKYGGKLVFGYSNFLLGLANFLIPTAAEFSVYALIALRVVQGMAGGIGIGNAINFFMSKWVPPHERGKFAATMSGLFFGASFSYFLNGFIDNLLGWRYIFYVTGTVSFLWSALWYFIVYDYPKDHPRISQKELTHIQSSIRHHVATKKLPIPWVAILTSVPLLVNTLGHFASMLTASTLMLYIPTYLASVFGLPSVRIGELSSLPYLLQGCFSVAFAAMTDNLIKRKLVSNTFTRKLATSLHTILAAVIFGAIALCGCNAVLVLLLITLGVMFSGATLSGIYPNIVDLSPNFCAAIHGAQGLFSSTTGMLSPLLVSYLTDVDKNDPANWNKVFLTTSTLNIICGILFLIFGESEVQWWNSEQEKKKGVNKVLLNEGKKVIEVKPSSQVV